MKADEFQHHILKGDEQGKYLETLDKVLLALENGFRHEKNSYTSEKLQEFAAKENWNLIRIPKTHTVYEKTADLVGMAREEYSWLNWKTVPDNPLKNKGYFEEITINAETGLPWSHDFLDLKRISSNAKELLEKMPSYWELAKMMRELSLEDNVAVDEVVPAAMEIHRQAMKRNYLLQLNDKATLIKKQLFFLSKPFVAKTMEFGGESLWNITLIDFGIARGMFQVYVIDAWQDNLNEPVIKLEDNGRGSASDELIQLIQGLEGNNTWYTLKRIDEAFESLHPVHASKILLGPFENRYFTSKGDFEPLGITGKILAEDKDAYIFRANRQYTYAPNHSETKNKIRQIIYTQDWNDTFLVTEPQYASKVADSVLGTSVRVITT